MIIFKQADELSEYISRQKKAGRQIGFVPTMGALHAGHLSLIDASEKKESLTVCSIFVNPTQFNNPEDYRLYPVTIEKDIERLVLAGCDVLFLPPVEEIYPAGYTKKQYDLGRIETILEGFYRPGHFQGVCQVVERLLQIVQPDQLFLGQKDFQQCIVIKKLIGIMGKEKEIQLEIVPTLREKDGLAMSSRNLRLNNDQRSLAASIFEELSFIKNNLNRQPLNTLKDLAKQHLAQKGFVVDYVEIANAGDLSVSTNMNENPVALVAASVGNIRLIDNLVLN
jgi:pantoate--beta-alanine ligase